MTDDFSLFSEIRPMLVAEGIKVLAYDTDTHYFEIEYSNGRGSEIDIRLLQHQLKNTKDVDRQEVLANFAKTILRMDLDEPVGFAEEKSRLMPIIRTASMSCNRCLLESVQMKKDLSATGGVYLPLQGSLRVWLALDSPEALLELPEKQLSDWGVSFEEAMDVATENLLALTDPAKLVEQTKNGAPGVYVGQWDDSFDAARILLVSLFRDLKIKGRPVVFAPTRDLLLLTGEDDEDGLAAILGIGLQRFKEARYKLSPELFVLDANDEWLPFTPKRFAGFIHRMQEADDYSSVQTQDRHLAEILLARNDEAALAPMHLAEDGTVFSLWSDEHPVQLIPRVGHLLLGRGGAKEMFAILPFMVAEQLLASYLEPEPGLFPLRYRVKGFPTDAEIEEVANHIAELQALQADPVN
jgi:uncharacterized protein YtpQ (UPF0354 family)